MGKHMKPYDLAVHAKIQYRLGYISKREALDIMQPYIKEYNEVSKRVAKKYNQKPKLFSFASFVK